jgi:Zn-finger nucleic acid-binding protein
MKATHSKPFDVTCPDCGGILKVDPETRAILSHTSAPRKRTFEDFESAAKAMREQDVRKEDIFRQSMEAEKNKAQLFDKRFEEALRKAKETPGEGRPLREFDLD